MKNVAMLQEIWGPIERGESYDFQPFFDSLDEGIIMTTSAGELRGKSAVVRYFSRTSELVDANPFERPLEYFSNEDRVAIVGSETFRVKKSGVTTQAEWAWVHDFRDGKVTRILAIQDLSGVSDVILEAMAAAR